MSSLLKRSLWGLASRWAIVLAGGEGKRLRPLIEDLFGAPIPKQYCTFCGTRSMLQHTVDRAAKIVDPNRILTVAGNGHRRFLTEEMPGRVIEQPAPRETAPGVFLPASYAMSRDPNATLIIFPSDHFIFPEDEFLDQIEHVSSLAERFPERLFLVGAVPEGPETDYGWIEPAGRPHPGSAGARQIVSFCEKPSREQASDRFLRGHLWNTMIVAVKAKTLWSMGEALLPELMSRFELLLEVLQATRKGVVTLRNERAFLTELYLGIPQVNFSRKFLARAVDRSMVWPLRKVIWSDWGCPERLRSMLGRIEQQITVSSSESEAVRRLPSPS